MRYRARRDPHEGLRAQLRSLAEAWPRYGYRRLQGELQRAGADVGRRLVWRLYREEGLKLRPHRKGQPRPQRGARVRPAAAPGERWAMDFIHDALRGGRTLRILSIVDEGSRACLALAAGSSLGSARVVSTLAQLAEQGAKPRTIVLDNGPEFRSRALAGWARQHGVELAFTEPGHPTQNAYVESFHARFRDECLNLHLFEDLLEARRIVENWRELYNTRRPHSSLGGLTPQQYQAALNPAA